MKTKISFTHIFILLFLLSCNLNSSSGKSESPVVDKSEPEVSVKYFGELRTRRTFADIQFMKSEKEREKYIRKQEKSNPLVYDLFTKEDSLLYESFKRFGLIEGEQFLCKKFKSQSDSSVHFIDESGQKFLLQFYYNQKSTQTHFKIFSAKDSIDVNTNAVPLQNLDYAFMDIIPGGNKELVFLDDYYIMNGDNYDLKVYEITTLPVKKISKNKTSL